MFFLPVRTDYKSRDGNSAFLRNFLTGCSSYEKILREIKETFVWNFQIHTLLLWYLGEKSGITIMNVIRSELWKPPTTEAKWEHQRFSSHQFFILICSVLQSYYSYLSQKVFHIMLRYLMQITSLLNQLQIKHFKYSGISLIFGGRFTSDYNTKSRGLVSPCIVSRLSTVLTTSASNFP